MKQFGLKIKPYRLTLVVLLAWVLVNHFIIFGYLSDRMMMGYLFVSIIANMAVLSFLANAAYYNFHAVKSSRYAPIAFFAIAMILNDLAGALMMFVDYARYDWLIDFFMSFGKMLFIFGCLPFAFYSRLDRFFKQLRWFLPVSLLLFVLQVFLSVLFFPVISGVTFAINVITDVLILIYVLELSGEERGPGVNGLYFGFILLLGAQLLYTLAPHSVATNIQYQIIQLAGIGYFFYDLNQSNFVIPDQMQERLQKQFNLYARHLKKVIDKKSIEVEEVNEKFIDELEYARKIQQSLLPNKRVNYRDVSFASEYFPCERLSGDFYDLYKLDDDNVGLYLLDVSGHGISAALMTMFSSNYLKSNDPNILRFRGIRPDRNLTYFYEQFNLMNFPDEMHIVVFYATLNLSTKVLTYCSGGLNCSPILFTQAGTYTFLDKSQGFPICKLSGFYTPEFQSEKIILSSGDKVIFFTDGLIDYEKNRVFDLDGLIEFLIENRYLSAREINEKMAARIDSAKDRLNDDITYIVMAL